MKKRIRKKKAKQFGSTMDYTITHSEGDKHGIRVLKDIQVMSVSLVTKEQAPIYLIDGKRMWYPIGSEKPVEVD